MYVPNNNIIYQAIKSNALHLLVRSLVALEIN